MQDYAGSEPLDPALADRFALLVGAPPTGPTSTRTSAAAWSTPAARGASPAMAAGCAPEVDAWRAEFWSSACRLARRWSPCLRHRRHDGAQRRRDPHLAAPGAAPRPQPPRRRHRDRQAEGAALPRRAAAAACRTPAGASGPAPRRSRPRTALAWDSASSASEAWVHSFLTEARLDRKLTLLLDHAKLPGCRLAGHRAVPAGRIEGARRRLRLCRLPGRRRRARCPSAPRASTTWPRSPRPILSVEGEVSWRSALREEHQPSRDRAHSQSGWPVGAGGASRAGPPVLRLVHGDGTSPADRPSWRPSCTAASRCSGSGGRRDRGPGAGGGATGERTSSARLARSPARVPDPP